MPGGNTGPIFTALSRSRKIRTVLTRDERLAATMAEAYGRLTGRPGVVMGQGAWIASNAGYGMLEALVGSAPMLVLTDLSDNAPLSHHAPYQSGGGEYGNWDARRLLGAMAKRTFAPLYGSQAVQDTQFAIKHAVIGQPGPTVVLFHGRSLKTRVDADSFPRLYATNAYVDVEPALPRTDSIEKALILIKQSERPVIIAGNGIRVSGAYSELEAFASGIGAPVATTAGGKGVFPETHELALGVFGNFGLGAANAVVSDADCVVAIGTKLGPTDTAFENPELLDPERQAFVQVDVEPANASWTFPSAATLIGDARAVLADLIERWDGGADEDVAGRVADAHRSHPSFRTPDAESSEVPLAPQRIIAGLDEVLPPESFIVGDAGENRLLMNHYYRTKVSNSYLQPSAMGGMGYAVPAALAAKLLYPKRPVIAVCGDGGMGMTLHGLLTAIEEKIPIIVLVFNNQALGWVLNGRGPFAARLGDFNYAQIAETMGCEGVRVSRPDELGPALRRALEAGRPAVVDVETSMSETFKDVTSPLVRALDPA
jgi:acetolactate synthase-1/2/3 large subunit